MFNSLLTFGAKSVDPKILEQTLTVRVNIVNEIEKNCVNKIDNSATWQSLIIAPRGSGKTHLIKVLYHRLKENNKIASKSVIAYMSEDEVGISNFTDLLVSILRAFIRYNEPGSETLESQISEASFIKDANKRKNFIKDILLKFAGKRIIILLIENFDNILKALGEEGQGNLRDFIHLYNNLSIIATSQNLIASITNSKSPFYNFFNIFQLEKLDFEQSVNFLEAIAKSEGFNELADEIKKPELESKLRAIYELTEGNHRLLVTFYNFLKADYKSELSGIFIKVMNDLKPYYEQFINALPPQQQKIVKYLSLNRRALSGKEIAIACFIEPNVISKQLSLLFDKGMIDKNKSGKDVFYELKEPLMRICFEISENPHGISGLFIDFLKVYYDRRVIQEKYIIFKYGARFQDKEIKNKYENEALMYSMVLSEHEQEKILFSHKVFDTIADYKQLDSIIHSPETGPLKKIDLSYDSFKKGNDLMVEKKYVEAVKCYQEAAELYPNNDTLLFQIGLAYGYLGKNEEALINFQKAIELNPGYDSAYANIGVALLNLKKYDEAIAAFQNAIRINPNDENYFVHLGSIFGNTGKPKDALINFQKAVKLNPEYDWAYFLMGLALSDLEQYKEAIDACQNAARINPNDENYFVHLGSLFGNTGKLEDALINFQKAVELNPENGEAYYGLGFTFSKLEQNKEAIEAFSKAVEIEPNNDEAYFGLGLMFSKLEQNKEAIEAFRKVVEINPKNGDAYLLMGLVLSDLEQYKEAIKASQKVVEFNPENEWAYLLMGIVFSELEQYKEVIKASRKAVEIDPNNKWAYILMGHAFSDLEQYEEAIEAFHKVVDIDSNNDEAFYHMGLAFFNLEQYNEAIKAYQEAVEIDPKNDEAYCGLGIAFLNLEQYKVALKAYKKALEINPKNGEAYYGLGIAFLNLEQYKEAIGAIRKVIGIDPNNDEAYFLMGLAFSNLEQYKEAINAYRKVTEINPEYENVHNNMGLNYLRIGEIDNAFEAFNIGLKINPENTNTNFSLLGAYIRINDLNKSKDLTNKLISKAKSNLLTIALIKDIFYNLFRFGSDAFMKSYFGFIIKLLLKERKGKELWKSLPDALFDILINIEDYENERLNNIEKTLTETLAEYKESIIPLKMFNVGVGYLKNMEKNDIYRLSKEERKLFKEAVLDKRE